VAALDFNLAVAPPENALPLEASLLEETLVEVPHAGEPMVEFLLAGGAVGRGDGGRDAASMSSGGDRQSAMVTPNQATGEGDWTWLSTCGREEAAKLKKQAVIVQRGDERERGRAK
jgi:hypothetical protein